MPTGPTEIAVLAIPLRRTRAAIGALPSVGAGVAGRADPIGGAVAVTRDTDLGAPALSPTLAAVGLILYGPDADITAERGGGTITGLDIAPWVHLIAGLDAEARVKVAKTLTVGLFGAGVGAVVTGPAGQTTAVVVTTSEV